MGILFHIDEANRQLQNNEYYIKLIIDPSDSFSTLLKTPTKSLPLTYKLKGNFIPKDPRPGIFIFCLKSIS